jgi:hypothetical protein
VGSFIFFFLSIFIHIFSFPLFLSFFFFFHTFFFLYLFSFSFLFLLPLNSRFTYLLATPPMLRRLHVPGQWGGNFFCAKVVTKSSIFSWRKTLEIF